MFGHLVMPPHGISALAGLPLAQATTPSGPVVEPRTTGGAAPSAPTVGPAAAPTANQTANTAAPGGAQTTQPGAAPDPGKANNGGGFLGGLGGILPIILMFVVLYFILFRGQRKEEKRRKELISELKKGDRVMTIGGLIARVVSIDGDEVVLKVDESANVKETYRKSAIQEVLVAGEDKK